jgi:malonyl-CoA O-methyltransferase
MKIDKIKLASNFNRHAGDYDHYAGVQRLMAQQLLRQIQASGQQFNRILEIGCGTGYFTDLLRQAWPQARIIALDLAPASLQSARRRLGNDSKIHWIAADGEQLIPGTFDLITSNSVFQWFSQPDRTCRRFWEHLLPGGWLAFTTLGPQTFQELSASLARAGQEFPHLATPTIPASRFADSADWGNFLLTAQFSSIDIQRHVEIATYPRPLDFLQALSRMGTANPHPTFMPRRILSALLRYYEANYRSNGTIPVSYDVYWIKGQKSKERVVITGQQGSTLKRGCHLPYVHWPELRPEMTLHSMKSTSSY